MMMDSAISARNQIIGNTLYIQSSVLTDILALERHGTGKYNQSLTLAWIRFSPTFGNQGMVLALF